MTNRPLQRPRIYLAGPLFSEAELKFNSELKRKLLQYVDVFLPQEDGGLLTHFISKGVPIEKAVKHVFDVDWKALLDCNAFVIILDGRTVDEGAAFELGCAYMLNRPCYGLRTDPRQLLSHGNNPMIEVPLKETFTSVQKLVLWAKDLAENPMLVNTPV